VARKWGKGKGLHRGEDTTVDEAATAGVGIVVRVMLHGGWRRDRGRCAIGGRMLGVSGLDK
jgi:hypothetical protein